VRVRSDEERPGDALAGAVLDDRLGDGGDVILVEGGVERGAPVPARAEDDALGGDGDIRMPVMVGVDEFGDVDEVGVLSRRPCAIVHPATLPHQ
jgi:hypothetical protein